jgi:hypothetical protein
LQKKGMCLVAHSSGCFSCAPSHNPLSSAAALTVVPALEVAEVLQFSKSTITNHSSLSTLPDPISVAPTIIHELNDFHETSLHPRIEARIRSFRSDNKHKHTCSFA